MECGLGVQLFPWCFATTKHIIFIESSSDRQFSMPLYHLGEVVLGRLLMRLRAYEEAGRGHLRLKLGGQVISDFSNSVQNLRQSVESIFAVYHW